MSREWSLQEVAEHNTSDSCWIIIENDVFDVTDYLSEHPGGIRLLLNFAGKDATKAIKPFHSAEVVRDALSPEKHLGTLDLASIKALKKQYAPLRKRKDTPRAAVTATA